MIVSFVGVYGGHYSEHCQKVTLVCRLCACTLCLFDGCCTCVFIHICKQFIVCVCVCSESRQTWAAATGSWQGKQAMTNGSGHDVGECGECVCTCLCTCTMVHCVCVCMCKHSQSFQRTYSRLRNSITIVRTITH